MKIDYVCNRMRLLLIYKFLEETDKDHPVTMKDIAAMLDKNDISWTRKIVYEDLLAIEIADYRFKSKVIRTQKPHNVKYYWMEK